MVLEGELRWAGRLTGAQFDRSVTRGQNRSMRGTATWTEEATADAIVIGAGLSGLIAAGTLQANGARVLVLDKGRGVGGRLATRRTHSGIFDHGAQFFTAGDPQIPFAGRSVAGGGDRAAMGHWLCAGRGHLQA